MINTISLQKADQLFFYAENKIKQNFFVDAKKLLQKAIKEDLQHSPSYALLGWIYEVKYYNFKKAQEYYEKALEHKPNYTLANINYAILLSRLEKYDELELHLKKIEKMPEIDKKDVYREFGLMYEKKRMYNEAINYYHRIINCADNKRIVQIFKDAVRRCIIKKNIKNN